MNRRGCGAAVADGLQRRFCCHGLHRTAVLLNEIHEVRTLSCWTRHGLEINSRRIKTNKCGAIGGGGVRRRWWMVCSGTSAVMASTAGGLVVPSCSRAGNEPTKWAPVTRVPFTCNQSDSSCSRDVASTAGGSVAPSISCSMPAMPPSPSRTSAQILALVTFPQPSNKPFACSQSAASCSRAGSEPTKSIDAMASNRQQ